VLDLRAQTMAIEIYQYRSSSPVDPGEVT